MLEESRKRRKILEISNDLRRRMMQKTMEQVFRLLESTEILLNNEGSEIIATGLYTHAVEEFGKFKVLEKSRRINGKIMIEHKKEFTDHDVKFHHAIKCLPRECTEIGLVGFEQISPTQRFEEGFEEKATVSDLKARWGVLFTDFSDAGDDVKSLPVVDKARLRDAIGNFRAFLSTPEKPNMP